MTGVLKAACIQINSGPEIEANLKMIEPLVREAHRGGAQLIALPENSCLMIRGRENVMVRARTEAEHPAIPFFKRLAEQTGAWILGGSLAIAVGDEKLANRSYFFTPDGKVVSYDKIHMFDADVGEGERYRESETFRSGNRAVTAEMPWGKIGFTICYDVRFPHLFRTLAKAGASVITVPAAFTVPTGRLHWHVLLRARAIETGAFILAPAQCGSHHGERRTYGHSLIVDPLGQIIAEAGEEPGIIMAELDLGKVAAARSMLPSLMHDCEFEKA